MLELRNPHSIKAALEVRPKAVKLVRVHSENPGEPWDSVVTGTTGKWRSRSRRCAGAAGSPRPERRPKGGKGGRETERTGAGSATVEPPSPIPLEFLWNTDEASTGLVAGT